MALCDEYVELINAAIDGALSPAEAEKLNAHLAQCPECRVLYEELTALHTALENLPPVEVPADLTERIMAAVAAEQVLPFASAEKKKSSVRWQRWLASAAVLAVVLMGTWSWKPWENQTPDTHAAPAQEVQRPAETLMPETASESVSLPTALSDSLEASSTDRLEATLPSADSGSGETRAKTTEREPDSPMAPELSEAISNEASADAIVPQMARMGSDPESPSPAAAPAEERGDSSQEPPAQNPVLFSVAPANSALDEPSPTPEATPAPALRSFLASAPDTPAESPEGQTLTAGEALALLLEQYPMPDCETWEFDDIEPGWRSPVWTEYGVDCWLQYEDFSDIDSKIIYGFNVYEDSDEYAPAVYLGYAVPADGGEIVIAGN